MIKVAICDDDIQFIYKLEQSIFRFAEMKRIKVDVDGYTSGAEFIQKLQQIHADCFCIGKRNVCHAAF